MSKTEMKERNKLQITYLRHKARVHGISNLEATLRYCKDFRVLYASTEGQTESQMEGWEYGKSS